MRVRPGEKGTVRWAPALLVNIRQAGKKKLAKEKHSILLFRSALFKLLKSGNVAPESLKRRQALAKLADIKNPFPAESNI